MPFVPDGPGYPTPYSYGGGGNSMLSSLGKVLGIGVTRGLPGLFNQLQQSTATRINGTAMPIAGYTPPVDPNPLSDQWNPMGGTDTGSSTDEIMRQLMALQDPSRYMVDQNSLSAQARAQAAMQYDPIISQLRNQEGQATTRANRNKQALGEMFGQLSDSIHGDLPAIQQNYDQTQQKTGDEYKQLEASINGQYKQSQTDQEDMYKRLNIQAAAGDVLPKQMENRDFFLNNARAEGQTQQSALTQEKQGAVDYTNRGSQMAKTEGTQRQADLMASLQDLLAQYDSQIGANEAAKSQAYTAGLGQLTQTANNTALQRAQQDFTNYIAATNLGRGLSNDAIDNMVKQRNLTQVGAVKSIADIAPRALSMGLPQSSAQNIQNVFNSSLTDPQILAGMDPTTGSPLSAEAKAQRIVEQGRSAGLSMPEINALQSMALEYFGRR